MRGTFQPVVKAKKNPSKDNANQLSRDQEKQLRKLKNKLTKIETQSLAAKYPCIKKRSCWFLA